MGSFTSKSDERQQHLFEIYQMEIDGSKVKINTHYTIAAAPVYTGGIVLASTDSDYNIIGVTQPSVFTAVVRPHRVDYVGNKMTFHCYVDHIYKNVRHLSFELNKGAEIVIGVPYNITFTVKTLSVWTPDSAGVCEANIKSYTRV